jgi:hypothetical protein
MREPDSSHQVRGKSDSDTFVHQRPTIFSSWLTISFVVKRSLQIFFLMADTQSLAQEAEHNHKSGSIESLRIPKVSSPKWAGHRPLKAQELQILKNSRSWTNPTFNKEKSFQNLNSSKN